MLSTSVGWTGSRIPLSGSSAERIPERLAADDVADSIMNLWISAKVASLIVCERLGAAAVTSVAAAHPEPHAFASRLRAVRDVRSDSPATLRSPSELERELERKLTLKLAAVRAFTWRRDDPTSDDPEFGCPEVSAAIAFPGVVLAEEAPEFLFRSVVNARDSFVAGHQDQCMAFCRAVIDAAAGAWLEGRGVVGAPPEVREELRRLLRGKWEWGEIDPWLRRLCSTYSPSLQRDVSRVRADANRIIHPKKGSGERITASVAVTTTTAFVEALLSPPRPPQLRLAHSR